jgi:hypothetical protein
LAHSKHPNILLHIPQNQAQSTHQQGRLPGSNPFADYFNHADVESASASFSPSGYTMTASRSIKQGDEIYISYGNQVMTSCSLSMGL